MSSMLSDYQKKEQMLKKLQEELLAMEENKELQNEIKFKQMLEELMKEYDVSERTVLQILAPEKYLNPQANTDKKPRKVRKLKVYKNPHTGEEISTRGGNHKGLKQWKDEYGDEVVEGWLINEDADNQPTPDVTPPVDGNKEETSSEETKQEEASSEDTSDKEAKEEKPKGNKKQEEKAEGEENTKA